MTWFAFKTCPSIFRDEGSAPATASTQRATTFRLAIRGTLRMLLRKKDVQNTHRRTTPRT